MSFLTIRKNKCAQRSVITFDRLMLFLHTSVFLYKVFVKKTDLTKLILHYIFIITLVSI